LQVLDFIELFKIAQEMCNLAKGLIFKALRALLMSFQQSYPQIFWITSKAL
jgi:hypothetical protein